MSEHAWGANCPLARTVPVGARMLPAAPGGELAPVAALLDRVRARLAGRPLRAFPAAAEATDRELARLGRRGDPAEVLREVRLMALDRAGHA
jgi:hypothetical protein